MGKLHHFEIAPTPTPSGSSATGLTVSLHLYMRLIETGRWLGLVPASVMRSGGKKMRLKVLPVKVSSPPAPIGFITVKDRALITPLAERFIECTRKIANSDIGRASRRRP
jgi:DNA-binding transcriptional LysR family regulator